MPLAALNKALIIVLTLFLTSDFGDILHGVAVHVSTDLSGFVERFKLPHDLYQPDGTFSWGQVRLFLVALSELRSRGLDLIQGAGIKLEISTGSFGGRRRGGPIHYFQTTGFDALLPDGPVRIHTHAQGGI
jgi:hypothetical protein